ncbi:MAG TPA: PBSX family phage terminase large subunit [Chitinophagaceae bacterium]|jgi:PBSX family phage terminase large subunit|nr:PBSX family phage terminase large subunit [Chitinophagaceae bacterium]
MQPKTYNIDWKWKEMINERFIELVDNRDRYLILWGGRGSSKSDFAAKKLIHRMLTEKYVRFILVRNQYNAIKDTSYQTLQDIIYNMGLQDLFTFKLNPLEIECVNGNRIMARGCDDTTKLKSIKDPTGCWYEEDLVELHDFITITTSIRSRQADYLQEIFTINPEVQGDHTQHWFWKRFFEGRPALNYRDVSKIEINPGEFVELTYTSHHSTYRDNRWITPQFVGMLEEMKISNPYYYTIYCLGRWGNKSTGGNFYKLFSIARNTAKVSYDPALPLRLSFDFNVLPGVSCSIFQLKGKILAMIDEIQLPSPRNTTRDVCREVIRKYSTHSTGMFIYGDPAGKHNDTRTEKGFNDYTIITGELAKYRPSLCVQNMAPPVVPRGNFLNTIFESGYKDVEIIIGERCTKMVNDLLYGLEAADGTKLKEKVKDRLTGVVSEKYHHFSDTLDYIACTIFSGEFNHYTTGGTGFRMMMGKSTRKNSY